MGGRRNPRFTPQRDEGWEARCRRCGRCCYEKVWDDNGIWVTDIPCRHLDPETGLCTVYPDRFEVEPDCLPVNRKAIEGGILPEDCPYVGEIPGYRGPKRLPPERN